MMYGRPNHTLITTMERAKGADEGPERSQARTKQRNQAKGAMMIGLSTTRTPIYGGHMMWLCNGWRRGPEARYSTGFKDIRCQYFIYTSRHSKDIECYNFSSYKIL